MHSIILFTRGLLIAEFLAMLAGFITWKKWKNSYLKWLPVYLIVITILEIWHFAFTYLHLYNYANPAYVIVVPFEMLFISWFFYKTLNTKSRSITLAGAAIYIAALVLEKTLFQNNTYYFQSLSYTIGNLFILIYLIIFFIELVKSANIFTFKRLTVFWIACGMLVFYLGTFPFYGLYNELAKDLDVFMPVAWVATALNYCMYLLFTIGFIWGKPH